MSTTSNEKLFLPANNLADEVAETSEERTTLYPKILKFSDFLYEIGKKRPPITSVQLTGSVKLHGTHADIIFVECSDEIRLQSRNQLNLNPDKDNAGFASFVAATEQQVLLNLRDQILERYHKLNPGTKVVGDLVIAGEWCGSGVQRKVGISNVPKFFAIVSMNINGLWVPDWRYSDIASRDARISHIGQSGFYNHELRLEDVDSSKTRIKELTDAVEKECPFAKTLGVSGPGEGIVWKATEWYDTSRYWFKSKGDSFVVSHSEKLPANAVDKNNRDRLENFAKAIVTENRLEQGWELLTRKDMAGTGAFLKWVIEDCIAEERREMDVLDIRSDQLKKPISNIAKRWFWARVERKETE